MSFAASQSSLERGLDAIEDWLKMGK
jgi:hypothetical protein